MAGRAVLGATAASAAARPSGPPSRTRATRPTGQTAATGPAKGQPGGKGAKANGKKANGRKQPRRKRGFFRRFWWVFVAIPLFLILCIIGTLLYAYAHIQIPPEAAGTNAQTTFVYDRFGSKIAELHGAYNRVNLTLKDIPVVLQNAVIDTEDKDYYHHGGISVSGIVRAAWEDLVHHGAVQGGSTITQQYVKNVYTGAEKSIFRKVKEALLAIKLEHQLTKQQILERYLNTIYFGHGAYGVEAASQTYFCHSAKHDNPVESATLAAMIASPGTFDPIDHPEETQTRRDYVLDQMVQQGHLDPDEAERLKSVPVKKEVNCRSSQSEHGDYAYFMDYTRKWLLRNPKIGEQMTYTGGLRVYSSLDKQIQKAAEEAVAQHLPQKTDPSAALVAIDPRNGEIRAMVGGPDPNELTNNVNLAVAPSRRQAGSAFKPFTLTAAMEQGYSLSSYWDGPAQITIPDRACYTTDPDTGKFGPWTLSNSADEESGTFRLIDATAFSVNTVFAQLVTKLGHGLTSGPEEVVNAAKDLGIQSELKPLCSITLGTQEVSPLEMTRAYATLAARGVRHFATPIDKVLASDDKTVLAHPDVKGTQAVPQNDADLVTYALQQVVRYGTGTAARLADRPVAGKTGTTNSESNAWFCGYIPQLAACVWVGYPSGNKPMHDIEGVQDVFGGTIPAEIWHDFMEQSIAATNMKVEEFPQPIFGDNLKPGPVLSPSPSPLPSPSPSPSPSSSVQLTPNC